MIMIKKMIIFEELIELKLLISWEFLRSKERSGVDIILTTGDVSVTLLSIKIWGFEDLRLLFSLNIIMIYKEQLTFCIELLVIKPYVNIGVPIAVLNYQDLGTRRENINAALYADMIMT
jgi:hypothetical protein